MGFKSNKAHKYDIKNDPLFLEYVHITGMTLTDLVKEHERD